MDRKIAELMAKMIEYDKGDARRIQHFVKVHDLAAAIGTLEDMEADVESRQDIQQSESTENQHQRRLCTIWNWR